MRERLLETLDESDYIEHEASKRSFLVYLMGPYKSYPPYDSSPTEAEVSTSRPTLDEIDERLATGELELELEADDALALLVALKQDLRRQTGVNAFLATDPQIPLEEMDAATQSIEYAKAAVATVFVAPAMGDNLGVGIETGSVCEHLDATTVLNQLLFLGETSGTVGVGQRRTGGRNHQLSRLTIPSACSSRRRSRAWPSGETPSSVRMTCCSASTTVVRTGRPA